MSCFAALFIYFIAGYDANNYNNNDRKLDQPDVFYCGGSSNIQIPSKYVNDNYCDCMETGNDEPYTSACNNGKFFCEIDNKYIHSSLVNDGIICDCSDGSDEWAVDSKCDKYHINIQNIQNDFNLFSQVINSMKHVYANILFPSYNAHIDNYENIKDVQQFLRKRRQNYQPNKRDKRDNTDKYKARLNNKEMKELIDDAIEMEITSQSSPSTLFFVIVVVAASSAMAMIGYIVKFRFLDKWKQGKQH